MVKQIDIKEAILDKTSHFNIKRFKIGNIDIEGPTKIINAQDLTKKIFHQERSNFTHPIFEISRVFTENAFRQVLEETDDQKLKQRLGYKGWISNYPFMLTHTLKFNPYNSFNKIEDISGYFDYYHTFSNSLLLIPNIKIIKYEKIKDKKTKKLKTKKARVIELDDYMKYVDESFEILNYKNKKPIFVPLSLNLNITEIKQLAQEYIEKGYFNIWIDFEGSAITMPKIARIKHFIRQFEDKLKEKQMIIYSTNIKREIISNRYDNESPSSDILASIIGSNLIGVNRASSGFAPQSLSKEQQTEQLEIKKHKARVFDSNTYYYLKLDVSDYTKAQKEYLLKNIKFNKIFNSVLLDNEFGNQTSHFLDKGQIEGYISTKKMINTFKEGELKHQLFEKKTKIQKWF